MFGIHENYDGVTKLSIAALCKELLEEYINKNPNDTNPPGEEYFREKIKSNDRSGLINKLNDNLGFDIEMMMEQSDQDKFDGLKLLKLLYYIEKDGLPKKDTFGSKVTSKLCITDILAKPRLENIHTDYSPKSEFGDVVDSMLSLIGQNIDDAGKRWGVIEKINITWKYATDSLFAYVFSDYATKFPESNLIQLKRIKRYLSEKIIMKCKTVKPRSFVSNEGVMKSFYNLLLCHEKLCNDIDRVNITDRLSVPDIPNKEFVSAFKETEKVRVDWKIIDVMTAYLKDHKENFQVEYVLKLVTCLNPLAQEDIKDCLFALKYVRTIARWIERDKNADFSDGISLDLFVIIMQELISVKREKETFNNDYFGNRYTKKPLLSAVKKPAEADAVARLAWIRKIENRTAMNFGCHELMDLAREIEKLIYKVKTIIFSYHSLVDMNVANDCICHFVVRAMVSAEAAFSVRENFERYIVEGLRKKGKNVRFVFPPTAINCNDMFREFLLDHSAIGDVVANEVIRQVDEVLNNEQIMSQSGAVTFESKYTTNYSSDYMFIFRINAKKRVIIFEEFVSVTSDEEHKRMRELGFDKFVVEELNNY